MRRITWNACLACAALLAGPAAAQQAPDAKTAPAKKDAGAAAAPAKNDASPPKAADPAIVVPRPEALLAMLRTALIALDHANKTNNYSVLRDLGGRELQALSASQLSDTFASLRTARLDLSPVAIVTPQLTEPPAITSQSLLNLVGLFPTQPLQIRFQIVFQPVDGRWRLFGLTVNVAPPAVAPAPSSESKPPADKKGKASATAAKASAEPAAAKK